MDEAAVIPPIEHLELDVGVKLAKLPDLPVLVRNKVLFQRGQFEIKIEVGEIEIRCERFADVARAIPGQRKGFRLVLPTNPVEVQDSRELRLAGVDESMGSARPLYRWIRGATLDPARHLFQVAKDTAGLGGVTDGGRRPVDPQTIGSHDEIVTRWVLPILPVVSPDPVTALTVYLREPGFGIAVTEGLDLLKGPPANGETCHDFDMETPGTLSKEELATPPNQNQVFFPCQLEDDGLEIVDVNLTCGANRPCRMYFVAFVQLLPRKAMLDHEALEKRTVHESNSKLLGHSVCDCLATALRLARDGDDSQERPPLGTPHRVELPGAGRPMKLGVCGMIALRGEGRNETSREAFLGDTKNDDPE